MVITKPRLAFTFAVLLGINFMNFYDRQILSAVQEKVRVEWNLNDKELGWLHTAFILLYAVVGVPLGRLADVWRRKWILAIGVGLWSVMTLASGFAGGFWSLFALRLGVGVGEASCAPAANSLIGDLVPPEKRARALSFFMLGLPLGLALSSIVSGYIVKSFDNWQAAFFVAAVPGLILACLAPFILEQPRGGHDAAGVKTETLPFLTVVHSVLRLPTMWWIIASGALQNFSMYALGSFVMSLLIRYHGVPADNAGLLTGVVQGCGALGIFAAGWLGDRAFRHGVRGRLYVAALALAGAVPCVLLALAVPQAVYSEAPANALMCAAFFLATYFLLYAYYGTVYATIQDIIAPHLRGMAMALYFCAMYFFGGMMGPVITGEVSDFFARQAMEAAGALEITAAHKAVGLHDALYLVPILNAVLVVVLIAASMTVKKDYERLHGSQPVTH